MVRIRQSSSMQMGGFSLNGAHFPKFGHFGSKILAHGLPKAEILDKKKKQKKHAHSGFGVFFDPTVQSLTVLVNRLEKY